MVRYSFLVGLFHPRLHAGLSRRLRSLTVAAPIRAARVSKRFHERHWSRGHGTSLRAVFAAPSSAV